MYSYDEDPDLDPSDDPSPSDDAQFLRRIFERFNIGADRHAHHYFRAGNRSLSVGDVVAIDDRYYACAESEWIPIDTPATIFTPEPHPQIRVIR